MRTFKFVHMTFVVVIFDILPVALTFKLGKKVEPTTNKLPTFEFESTFIL